MVARYRSRPIKTVLRLVFINLFVFCALVLGIEVLHRTYSAIFHGHSFFFPERFISPWITTFDYPPPMIADDGNAYFRHRTVPTPLKKPPETIRIIAVGGSTTANEYAFSKTGIDYPLSLENRLSESSNGAMRFEVLNAGSSAFSTAQSLINIQFRLVEYQPDFIVLMHNINDSSVNSFDAGATSDYSNKYLKSYYLNPTLQRSRSFVGFLMQFRFLSKLGLIDLIVNRSGDLNPAQDIRVGLHYFKRNITTISNICRQHRIQLILLTQPFSMKDHPQIHQGTFMTYNLEIKEVSRDRQIHFVDMFAEFGHDSSLFTDQFHYTPKGIDKFSDILTRRLQPVVDVYASEAISHSDEYISFLRPLNVVDEKQ